MDCVSVGEAPKQMMRAVETVKFVIYDFKDRKEKRSEPITSSILKAHGYEWYIRVYPRGDKLSSFDREFISCYLVCETREMSNLSARFALQCNEHQKYCDMVEIFR